MGKVQQPENTGASKAGLSEGVDEMIDNPKECMKRRWEGTVMNREAFLCIPAFCISDCPMFAICALRWAFNRRMELGRPSGDVPDWALDNEERIARITESAKGGGL